MGGSLFLFALQNNRGHYGATRGGYPAAAPAGSVFLTVYSIWHRRSASTVPCLRNMLKYNYWRTAPPRRDWRDAAGSRPPPPRAPPQPPPPPPPPPPCCLRRSRLLWLRRLKRPLRT